MTPEVTPETVTAVRIAPSEQPVAPGDCAEALRRAAAKPGLAVDRIPSPIVAKPAALQKVPRTALRKDGSADVKVDVLIDTLGRPDMKTFTVVTASNPWLVIQCEKCDRQVEVRARRAGGLPGAPRLSLHGIGARSGRRRQVTERQRRAPVAVTSTAVPVALVSQHVKDRNV